MSRTRKALLGLAALSVLLAGSAWAITSNDVCARIRKIILSRWTTSGLYVNVEPYQSDALTQKGSFKTITAKATSATFKGVTMKPFYLKGYDVTLDLQALTKNNRVKTLKIAKTDFNGKITQSSINKLIRYKKTPVEDLQVTFGDGVIVLTGKYKLVMGHQLRLEGKLEIEDHCKINFIPTRASVNAVPLPAGPLKTVLSKINPLVDSRELPLKPKLDKIIVKPTGMTIEG